MADSEGNSYGPYDTEVEGSEAEGHTESNWARLNRQSGVYAGGDISFTGLTATLTGIDMVVRGFWLDTTDRLAAWTHASTPTSGAQARRDLLVARRQLTAGDPGSETPGSTFLTVIPGSPASTPVNPPHDPDNDVPLWSWQVPGGGGTVVTNVTDHRRVFAANGEMGAQGVVSFKKETEQVDTAGPGEARMAGGHNTSVYLQAGRAYEVVDVGIVSLHGAGGSVQITDRISTATPTTSSPVVATAQKWVINTGGPWQADYRTGGQPFRVAASGIYQIHRFGQVRSGSATGVAVLADARGIHSIAVKDIGPATPDMPTV